MIDWTLVKCTCEGFENLTCLACIYSKQRKQIDIVYLKAYEKLLKSWDGNRKFTKDEMTLVQYCVDNNLHPV